MGDFCTRRKKNLYAYKINFFRDADIFSSGRKIEFLPKRHFFRMQKYDKPSRKRKFPFRMKWTIINKCVSISLLKLKC